jgi:SAM-dependent methyltransferase
MASPDFSPSAERNKQPILDVLRTYLPEQGSALEIASGTGQHVVWFARQLPQWTWQPTDMHRGALYNIEMRANEADLENVQVAVELDVLTQPWPLQEERFDLVLCINMLHIAPWASCAALMQSSASLLQPGGLLVTYGPYFEDGVPPTPSNVAFDQSLRAHDPSWGIRRREDVEREANAAGLQMLARHEMPANNLMLVFRRPTDNLTP